MHTFSVSGLKLEIASDYACRSFMFDLYTYNDSDTHNFHRFSGYGELLLLHWLRHEIHSHCVYRSHRAKYEFVREVFVFVFLIVDVSGGHIYTHFRKFTFTYDERDNSHRNPELQNEIFFSSHRVEALPCAIEDEERRVEKRFWIWLWWVGCVLKLKMWNCSFLCIEKDEMRSGKMRRIGNISQWTLFTHKNVSKGWEMAGCGLWIGWETARKTCSDFNQLYFTSFVRFTCIYIYSRYCGMLENSRIQHCYIYKRFERFLRLIFRILSCIEGRPNAFRWEFSI